MAETENSPASAPHRVYLALGSNQGDRLAHLRAAVAALRPFVTIDATSSVYDTEPMLVRKQPRFLNAVLAGWTTLTPLALLHAVKRIEVEQGRRPGKRYGPRPVDIDVLFYDDVLMETPELTLPHPRLTERAFVLVPLAEIAPGYRHPALPADIATLAAALPPADVVRQEPASALLPPHEQTYNDGSEGPLTPHE